MESSGGRTKAGANDRDDDHDEIDESLEVFFFLGGSCIYFRFLRSFGGELPGGYCRLILGARHSSHDLGGIQAGNYRTHVSPLACSLGVQGRRHRQRPRMRQPDTLNLTWQSCLLRQVFFLSLSQQNPCITCQKPPVSLCPYHSITPSPSINSAIKPSQYPLTPSTSTSWSLLVYKSYLLNTFTASNTSSSPSAINSLYPPSRCHP